MPNRTYTDVWPGEPGCAIGPHTIWRSLVEHVDTAEIRVGRPGEGSVKLKRARLILQAPLHTISACLLLPLPFLIRRSPCLPS
jgi:hypothetical protein